MAAGGLLIGGWKAIGAFSSRSWSSVKSILGKGRTSGGKGVTNPEVVRLAVPSVPEGMSRSQFGRDLIGWGRGADGARNRLTNINPSIVRSMQEQGLTRGMASSWRSFYSNEFSRNSNNTAAAARVELMNAIIDHL